MSALGLAELADRTLLEPGGWSVVVVDEARIDATTRGLEEELTSWIEEEGVGSVRVFPERPDAPALVAELSRMTPEDVAVLPLPAGIVVPVSRALDYKRAQLLGRPRGVIVTSRAGLQQLAAEAPAFWSWVGPRVWALTDRLVDAVTSAPDAMSVEEAKAFEAWLRELAEPVASKELSSGSAEMAALVRSLRWHGLTALFFRGDAALEPEVRYLLLEHLGAPDAPELFGRYLTALSRHAPERLEDEAAQLLAAAGSAGCDPLDLLPALGHVILVGPPRGVQAAQAALRAIAARPPFVGDSRTQKLLGTLGLR